MVTVGEIYDYINTIAPFSTQLGFDNAGLLVGDRDDTVHRAGCVLDITCDAVENAKKAGCDLIISHHPVIFHPLKSLSKNNPVYHLAAAGIAAISAHTNLDAAGDGVNQCLAQRLGLTDIIPLGDGDENYPPMARTGNLSFENTLSCSELAKKTVELLNSTGLRYYDSGKRISRVAVCGGAGSDFIEAAANAGVQCLITAEIKHHEYLLAAELGLNVIDAGHFATENVVVAPLCEKISARFPEFDSIILEQPDILKYIAR